MDTPEQDLAKQELDQISDKCLKILELRYQIAIIIIPTIIGLWGFIGIIATSIFFNLNPLFIPLIVYIGVFVTIFLIYLWRIRVHDLFKEERSTILRKSHLRQKIRYNGRYPSEIENDTLYEIKSMNKINTSLLNFVTRHFTEVVYMCINVVFAYRLISCCFFMLT